MKVRPLLRKVSEERRHETLTPRWTDVDSVKKFRHSLLKIDLSSLSNVLKIRCCFVDVTFCLYALLGLFVFVFNFDL